MTEIVGPLSPEELLARSAANVAAGRTSSSAPKSAVQKLLAERDTPLPEDVVELSPVQKLLEQQRQQAAEVENYFESDEFLQLKVSQLRGQIALYTTLPGLDPTGAIIGGIEAEIRGILEKQQAELAESNRKAQEAQAKLAEQEAAEANALPSAADLLARVQGKAKPAGISKEAQALLDKVKGTTVNTTA